MELPPENDSEVVVLHGADTHDRDQYAQTNKERDVLRVQFEREFSDMLATMNRDQKDTAFEKWHRLQLEKKAKTSGQQS